MMLGTHVKFLAQVNPSAARETKTRLLIATRSLADMPERHPFFEDEPVPKGKYHKMFVEKWYLLLYQIKDQTVFVDYIWDCRQDYGWLIQ
jgi:plasmid stabilization system protein ParE